MKEKIGAVIVTMNRKILLGRCVDSLLKQEIGSIIIVDNSSNNETRDFIKTNYKNNKIFFIKNKKNLGSAGGYNIGLKEAYKQDLEWVWLFDDDCEVTKEALKRLKIAKSILEKDRDNIGFLSSRSTWLDGGCFPISIRFSSKTWAKYLGNSIIEIRWEHYTGLFVNMKAVISEGLPIKEFFIYEDDTEFTHRITRKYKGFLVGNSEILNKDYMSKRKGRISLGEGVNFKRYYYSIRNSVYFARSLIKDKEDKKLAVNQFIGITKNMLLGTLFSKK